MIFQNRLMLPLSWYWPVSGLCFRPFPFSLSVSQLSLKVFCGNSSLQCDPFSLRKCHRMKFAIVLPFKHLISIINRQSGAERIWNAMSVEMPLKRNLFFG